MLSEDVVALDAALPDVAEDVCDIAELDRYVSHRASLKIARDMSVGYELEDLMACLPLSHLRALSIPNKFA